METKSGHAGSKADHRGVGAGQAHALDRAPLVDLKVLGQWLKSPRQTGAVAASGPFLAKAMAAPASPEKPGTVIEFGPGTGPVTRALLKRGFSPDRLVLIEMNADFRRHLSATFPGVHVVDGDAFRIRDLVEELGIGEVNSVVSSLPLLHWPRQERKQLLLDALSVMPKGNPFIQFTYGLKSSIEADDAAYTTEKSHHVWLNLPPAMVWVYRAR